MDDNVLERYPPKRVRRETGAKRAGRTRTTPGTARTVGWSTRMLPTFNPLTGTRRGVSKQEAIAYDDKGAATDQQEAPRVLRRLACLTMSKIHTLCFLFAANQNAS